MEYTPPPAFPSSNGGSSSNRIVNCLKTAGNGFFMGAAIGISFGIVLGGMSIMSPQYRGQRIAVLSQTCLQMGGVFGGFLAVGSVIRGGC